MFIVMNNKFRIISITVFVFLMALFASLLTVSTHSGMNCTGTLTMNNPRKNDYLFTGTITVKLFADGNGSIRLYGISFSRLRPEDSMKHLVYRDIFFKFRESQHDTLTIDNIRTVLHPMDNTHEDEASGILFDIFDIESRRLTVRKVSNGYVFGDNPVPSFICVRKE